MRNNFSFLKIYFSPFKPIIPKLYVGRVAIGVPYFYPRVWKKDPLKPGSMISTPKKIGFNFLSLGWKTKWEATDYRHEWNPIWSFVFFKWQIALIFTPQFDTHYWECWLYYSRNTDKTKSTRERIKQAREEFPCVWTSGSTEKKEEINYWTKILKNKYL